MKRMRIRDLPFAALYITRKPYFLDERMLSVAEGFIPALYGGYKRTPAWTAHWTPGGGDTIIGCSRVGPIAAWDTPQITVAKKTASAITQYRVLANGSGGAFNNGCKRANRCLARQIQR